MLVGFSAGGIDPLLQMVSALPRDLPASLFVVHRCPPQSVTALPASLRRTMPRAAVGAGAADRGLPLDDTVRALQARVATQAAA